MTLRFPTTLVDRSWTSVRGRRAIAARHEIRCGLQGLRRLTLKGGYLSMINVKRAYESASRQDGKRFLVDRVWPRGVTKDKLEIDGWLKDVAPSTELRKWFGHDPARWNEFQQRYRRELGSHKDA